ncbi:MAG: methionyl-tRNA formyltransferase, partial [Pyrinomonadaceae bacterium]
FKSHNADAAVVVAYGRILPTTFLTAYPRGAINVHFSLLPKYRGAAPVNWALVNGEAETGVTTMQMDAGLDTGAILLQTVTNINVEETSIDLMSRLSFIGAGLLSETLLGLNELEPVTQDHAAATFARIMKREDGLIDWKMSAKRIANRIRGFQPFPSTFTHFQQQKVTIWKAVALDENVYGGSVPGEVIEAHADSLVLLCGDSRVLKIEEIQPEGKRRMPVRDFLNGFKLQKGSVFGV